MQTLPRTGISLPDLTTDPFTYRAHLAAIAGALEQQGVIYTSGVAGSRPAAGKQGRVHFFTDSGEVWWDTGASWVQVNPAPIASAAPATPSLRRLGTGATDAAAGSHAAQHAPGGADPLPATVWVSLNRGSTSIPAGAAGMLVDWQSVGSGTASMWSAGSPSQVILPHRGLWAFELRASAPSPGVGVRAYVSIGADSTAWTLNVIGLATSVGFLRSNAAGVAELQVDNPSGAAVAFSDLRLRTFFVAP